MELFKHELYKIFSNKGVCILIILFIILNGIYFTEGLYLMRTDSIIVSSTLKNYEGKLNDEKTENAFSQLAKMEKNSQESLGKTAKERFLIDLYIKIARVNGAYATNKENIETAFNAIAHTRGFDYRRNQLFYNMMSRLQTGDFYYTGGWDNITEYIYTPGAALIAFLILLALSSMFSGEYSTKMDSIILSTKYGKTKLIRAKTTAAAVFILLVDMFFILLNLIEKLLIYGIRGWNVPMHFLINYVYTPFDLTVVQFYCIEILVHLLGCIVFGLFILLLSSINKMHILTFFIGTTFLLVPFILDNVIDIKVPFIKFITKFSFIAFMQVKGMFTYFQVYDVFGYPLFYPFAAVIVMLIFLFAVYHYIKQNFSNHPELDA
jgi:hypothetical protein